MGMDSLFINREAGIKGNGRIIRWRDMALFITPMEQ
jgi:hypothetical protein